jgi:hypothetical protein
MHATRVRRRARRNPETKRSVTYRADFEPLVRTIYVDSIQEHDGGDVTVRSDDRQFPRRIESKRVIAVDGVKRSKGDASELFSRAVPTPKSADRYKHAREFYDALKASRTLREAVKMVRDECDREGGTCNFRRKAYQFDVATVYDDDGHPRLRDKAEFTGGVRWDQKERDSVSLRLFDALVAWNVLDEPYKVPGDKSVYAEGRRRGLYLDDETFTYIARDIHNATGNGLRTLDSPVWRMFGMSERDVEMAFYHAHQYRFLDYWRQGSVVSLTFLDREAQKNGRRSARKALAR